ncbi:hypothetical protein [Nostoc sp.]|uniref:hypothetical protein n=1 Tax=Nostoc sp. TaxID=1180 RepID=UPI002FF99083
MTYSTAPVNQASNSQSSEHSNYFIDLTLFIAGHEIKVEIPITKQQLRAISEDERKCVPSYESTMADMIDSYLNENFESEGFIREKIQSA